MQSMLSSSFNVSMGKPMQTVRYPFLLQRAAAGMPVSAYLIMVSPEPAGAIPSGASTQYDSSFGQVWNAMVLRLSVTLIPFLSNATSPVLLALFLTHLNPSTPWAKALALSAYRLSFATG